MPLTLTIPHCLADAIRLPEDRLPTELLCERVVVVADGRIALELDANIPRDTARRALVTSPAFIELRERALEAIG